MVAETFAKAMQGFARRKPFKPFIVELTSGQQIIIEHPEAVVYRAGKAVFLSPQGDIALFDHEGVSQVCVIVTKPAG